jgi:hypothetical protein
MHTESIVTLPVSVHNPVRLASAATVVKDIAINIIWVHIQKGDNILLVLHSTLYVNTNQWL